MVQGAAAEFFKVWAVTVRASGRARRADRAVPARRAARARPDRHGDAVADLIVDCLADAARHWAPDDSVRFVADVSTIRRWSDSKP